MSQLIETISRKPIPPHKRFEILEITAEDVTEEDIEVPWVMLKLGR